MYLTISLLALPDNGFCVRDGSAAATLSTTTCGKRKIDRLFFDVTVLAPDKDFIPLVVFVTKLVDLRRLSNSKSFLRLPESSRRHIREHGLRALTNVRIDVQSNSDDSFVLDFENGIQLNVQVRDSTFRWGQTIE
jgi:hypothetical protein